MIDWLVETCVSVTALMLLVLALRRPVAHFFGAGWAYALWLLPALRMVLPPLHIFGDALPSLWHAAPAAPVQIASTPAIHAVPAIDWQPFLLAGWLTGAVLIVLWQSWSYIIFVRRLGIGSQVHASLAQDIGVIESAEVDGPLAIGLLDRWIVVPADFTTRYTPQEQRLALQHERTHHQREDIFCNMFALGVLALNWFNPVAYIAFRAFRSDQELSCDAAVAARASADERHDYARALVKSASTPGLIAACPLNDAGQLKRRLRMMKAHRSGRLRALAGSSAVAAIILAGISVTESASIAAPQAEASVSPPKATAPAKAVPAAKPAFQAAAAAPEAPQAPRAPIAPKQAAQAVAAVTASPNPAPAALPVPDMEEPAATPARRMVLVRVVDSRAQAARLAAVEARAGHLAAIQQFRTVRAEAFARGTIPPELEERVEKLVAGASRSSVTRFQIRLKQEQEN